MLVDDDDLSALDHVVHVSLEQGMCLERGMHVMQEVQVGGCVEAVTLFQKAQPDELFLDLLVPVLGQLDLAVLLIDNKVSDGFLRIALDLAHLRLRLRLELGRQQVDLLVELGAFLRGSGDDQRGAGFVDED